MEKLKKAYRNLLVWKQADDLALEIFELTSRFPKEEIYGITSQLRRAALSVPTNIVKGTGRQSQNQLKHFVNIALGSLFEVEYLLEFSLRLKLLQQSDYDRLENLRKSVGALLWRFYQSIRV